MKQMADRTHLVPVGDTYYFRLRVPKDLLAYFGKTYIKKSLGTKSIKEAKKLRTIELLKCEAQFAAARESLIDAPPPKADDAGAVRDIAECSMELLTDYVRSAVASDTERFIAELRQEGPSDLDGLKELRIDAQQEWQIMTDPGDPRRDQVIRNFGKSILAKKGYSPKTPLTPEFLDIVQRAVLELGRRWMDRLDHRYDRPFHDVMFDQAAKPIVTIEALSKDYIAEKTESYEANNVGQQRKDKLSGFVSVLVELLGPDTPAHRIDYDAVKQVRSQLAQLPKNCSKIYPGLSLALAIAKGREEGRPGLSSTTQGDYLATLRDMLQLGFLKGCVEKNFAADLQPLKRDGVADRDKRKPFDEKQIATFFTSDFYRSCATAAAQPYGKKDRDWRFWMPLIMAFAGARPNEIAQLRVRDIRRTDAGTWYFDLANEIDETDEAPAIKLKTESSKRRTPIHPELIKIGLLSFVQRRRQSNEGENAVLFTGLRANTYGNLAHYAAKRFREKFLPEAITVRSDQSFYSIRHSVRDALRRIEAPGEALWAICGWSDPAKAVSGNYGDPGNPDLQAKWVNGIAYKDLDLSFLYGSEA